MATPLTLKESSAFAVPFLVCVGACYSFGYWGHFNIDILQFVGLADLAKLAIYPLLLLAVSTPLTIAFSEVALRPAFPIGGGSETRVGRVGLKYWRVLVLANLIILIAVAIWGSEPSVQVANNALQAARA